MEKFIKQLVRDAGGILRDNFGKVGVLRTKSNVLDVVTVADELADKLITERIKKKFPSHAIISEESGTHNNNPKKWIIDPLDGTSNFSKGIPLFVTQLAYTENNKVKIAAIYDPIHDNLFYAEKGKGAYLNDSRIFVAKDDRNRAMITVSPDRKDPEKKLFRNLYYHLPKIVARVRDFGSTALELAYVARGGLEANIQLGLSSYDFAAGVLLVEEARGKITKLDGSAWTFPEVKFVASNGVFHERLVEEVQKEIKKLGWSK